MDEKRTWTEKGHQMEETQAEKTSSEEETYNIYTNSRLFRAMRPLFCSLTIFGMYFTRKYGPLKECCLKVKCNKIGESYTKPSRMKRVTASMIYAWCLFVAYAVFYLRLFSMFAVGDLVFGTELVNKLIIITWFTTTMVTFIMCMRASYRYEGIPKYFIELDSAIANINEFEQYLRKATWVVVSMVWFYITICIILVVYGIILYPAVVESLFAPLMVDHPDFLIMQIIAGLFQPLINALWSFGLATDFIFSYMLYRMFKCWRDKFRAKCSAGITSAEFEQEQINHQKLCRLVGHVDDFFVPVQSFSIYGKHRHIFVCHLQLDLPARPLPGTNCHILLHHLADSSRHLSDECLRLWCDGQQHGMLSGIFSYHIV